MKWWKLDKNQMKTEESSNKAKQDEQPFQSKDEITGNLTADLNLIRKEIGHNADVKFREFQMGTTGIRTAIIFIEGLANEDVINNHILIDFMSVSSKETDHPLKNSFLKEYIKNQALSVCGLMEVRTLNDITSGVMFGSIAILVDGIEEVFLVEATKSKTRNIDEPPTESLVRGPRVGFIENLKDNTALLRRHGKDQNLTIVSSQVGERSKKELVIIYMKDLVDPHLLEEVKQRINKIKMDDIHDSSYIEQLIEDNFISPFPQVQSTERPDRVMAALMEGRVALLLDGSPFALIVPVTFHMMLQSPEDYYERWMAATLIRLLRYFSAFIALFGPSLYIAFTSFHPGLIPTKLIFSIAANREGVPFPPLIEALIMEVSIEVLREAGLRLPKPIGQSIGIVGGLVVGEAAVQAGIVSPIMVIVVAVTAISSFTLPQYNIGIALRILRFASMFFASVFGLYGVVLFFLVLCTHLVRLKSFGIPYVSPAASFRLTDWKDFMIRLPLFLMKRRPKLLYPKDSVRKE
ncbi:spore germination protein [Bacillus sp. JJ1764]|uniref:spore germination protein n=1 Tax=Bacillus sp. JJ1764 TaxID=3122964 RepID=UPI003F68AACB